MINLLKVGGLAAVLAVAVASQASSQVTQVKPLILQLNKIVTCKVAGSPSEFPDDLWFFNKGVGTIAKGTKVLWNLPGTTTKGQFVLNADLTPGKAVFAGGILGNGYEADRACSAKVA
jgi:hypothetical protein